LPTAGRQTPPPTPRPPRRTSSRPPPPPAPPYRFMTGHQRPRTSWLLSLVSAAARFDHVRTRTETARPYRLAPGGTARNARRQGHAGAAACLVLRHARPRTGARPHRPAAAPRRPRLGPDGENARPRRD